MTAAKKTTEALAAIPLNENVHSDEVTFKVRDTTATAGAREHMMLDENGRQVPFRFLDSIGYINCPYRYALRFARIAEFEVLDPNGRRIMPVPQQNKPAGIQLSENETIAAFSELTAEALHKRAKAAGGSFKPNASRAQIITFLTNMAGMTIVDSANQAAQASNEDDEDVLEFDDEDGIVDISSIAEE